MKHFFVYRSSDHSGDILSTGITDNIGLYTNAIECTLEQHLNYKNLRVDLSGEVAIIVTKSEAELLPGAKITKIDEISRSCRAHILSGFESDALETTHHYPNNETDQTNLQASILDSLLPGKATDWSTPFWCMDESGVWGFKPHTAAQIQMVGRAAKAHVVNCLTKNSILSAQIESATSLSEIDALNW